MKTSKKVICLLLTLIMVVSSLPMVAVGVEATENDLGNIAVIFDANGGTGSMTDHYFTVRHYLYRGFSIPSCSFKNEGYEFIGWYIQRWSDKRWYCIDKSRGGICDYYTEEELKTKSAFTKLLVPTGYDGNVFTSDSYNDTFICYAQWKKTNSINAGTISYQSNGGSGFMSDTAIVDDSVTLSKNTFVKAGHKFIGWNVFRVSDSKWFFAKDGCCDWYTVSKANELHLPKLLLSDCCEWGGFSQGENYICYAQWQQTQKYYNTYGDVAAIKPESTVINGKKYNFCSVQAIAVGSTYIYSVVVDYQSNTDNSNYAYVYKTNKYTGNTQKLLVDKNNKNYPYLVGGFMHANDMCLTTINEKSNLFVTTGANNSWYSLFRMEVSGSTISTKGKYYVKYNNQPLSITSVSILEKTNNTITFLFKNGTTLYKGTIGINQTSGTIIATKVCTLNVNNVLINGKYENLSSFRNQGMSCYNNKLYVAMSGTGSKENVSVVVVYENIKSASGVKYSSPNLSFRITSNNYQKFEMESCGISSSDGKLYFNTNRSGNKDGIHYFKGFNAN